jgi:hypothetical protein
VADGVGDVLGVGVALVDTSVTVIDWIVSGWFGAPAEEAVPVVSVAPPLAMAWTASRPLVMVPTTVYAFDSVDPSPYTIMNCPAFVPAPLLIMTIVPLA